MLQRQWAYVFPLQDVLGYIYLSLCMCLRVCVSRVHLQYMHEPDAAWGLLHSAPQVARQRVSTAGREAEGGEPPLKKLVETSVLSLASCCLTECVVMGERARQPDYPAKEIEFAAPYDCRTSYAEHKTEKRVLVCFDYTSACVVISLNLLHWPIKNHTIWGGKRIWLLFKQLQYSPGGRHGNDVTCWNTWRDLKTHPPLACPSRHNSLRLGMLAG